MFIHKLLDRPLDTIYVNQEQSEKPAASFSLTQESIRRAFSSKQRQSRYTLKYHDLRIMLLSGKHTGRLEVQNLQGPQDEPLAVTSLERTLIDITVRPAYAGGVKNVSRAFMTAKDRVSTKRMLKTLAEFAYAYPYHQALGFYMDRAGFPKADLEHLRSLGLRFDFYLAHGLRKSVYSRRWRLFHPEEL